MNIARCNEYDYINFLVASPRVFSCLEAGRVQPHSPKAPSHDSLNRMLNRKEPNTDDLWKESQNQVDKGNGLLILDDSTLDKPYSKKIELVARHWSGKHHKTVQGINLLTLLWSDGDKHIPCDYRVYAKDGNTKNTYFTELLKEAYKRKFKPAYICFDSWYSSLKNLKYIRGFKWQWLTRLKSNRLVNPDGKGNIALAYVEIGKQGRIVHLKGYGFIKVFRTLSTKGKANYWATSDLNMNELERVSTAEKVWTIENYHRGIKQFCGIEKCAVRSEKAQRNHIEFALRAFLRLEIYSYTTGYSWFEAKMSIFRDAIRSYLQNPLYTISSTA